MTPAAAPAPLNVFERYLTLWVFLCIVAGIVLGQLLPGPIQAIGRMEFAQSQPAGGPTDLGHDHPDALLKVDFGALAEGSGVTGAVNGSKGWYERGIAR